MHEKSSNISQQCVSPTAWHGRTWEGGPGGLGAVREHAMKGAEVQILKNGETFSLKEWEDCSAAGEGNS